MEPKTWLDSEIIALIEQELRGYRQDCNLRTRNFSWAEAAENVFVALNDKGLIENTP